MTEPKAAAAMNPTKMTTAEIERYLWGLRLSCATMCALPTTRASSTH